jgi:hypothetical protein
LLFCVSLGAPARDWAIFQYQECYMRHLVTIGFIAAALAAYCFGFQSGSGLIFLAGVACELVSFKRMRDMMKM